MSRPAPRRHRRLRLRRAPPAGGAQGGPPDLRPRPALAEPRSGAPVHPNITLAPGRHRRPDGARVRLREDRRRGRGRRPHPPRRPLRLHRRGAPRVLAHERPRPAERARALARPRAPALRLLELRSPPAACPPPGQALDEASPPDGEHIYARTKRAGEEMLREYRDALPVARSSASRPSSRTGASTRRSSCSSSTWLSRRLEPRDCSGAAASRPSPTCTSATRCASSATVLARLDDARRPGRSWWRAPTGPSPTASCSRRRRSSTSASGDGRCFMPRPLCGPGMWARDLAGRLARRAALRAAVDGPLHRHPHDRGRPAGPARSSAGSRGRASWSCGGCRS